MANILAMLQSSNSRWARLSGWPRDGRMTFICESSEGEPSYNLRTGQIEAGGARGTGTFSRVDHFVSAACWRCGGAERCC